MIRIGILGYSGRMGSLIAADILSRKDCALAGGVVRALSPSKNTDVFVTTDAQEVIKRCDVMIDFSATDVAAKNAELCAQLGKPLVCGITGLDNDTQKALRKAAEKIPLLYASNTSVSLAAMKHITRLAAKLLGKFDYDVAILDEHHRMKKDAPSGTAKTLGETVLAGNGGIKKPEYAAVRAGHIVGEHDVIFAGDGETIRLRHSVTDRSVFAKGAVDAALWLAGMKPGYYGMDDVLGIG